MQRRQRFGRWHLPLLLAALFTASLSAAGAQELVAAQDLSAHLAGEDARTGLGASGGLDSGAPVNSSSPVRLERMLLLLESGKAKQDSLARFLIAQQTPGDASFHKWLTPAEFADRFASTAKDSAAVVSWLRAQGFAVAALPASRGWIEFSGTAMQVERAFAPGVRSLQFFGNTAPFESIISSHIEMASSVQGEARYRLPGEIHPPISIAPMVKGLVSLDGVLATPAVTSPVLLNANVEAIAQERSLLHPEALTPSLTEDRLHLGALRAAGLTGAGERIAIPSRSNVRQEDFTAFRKSFGLADATLSVELSGEDPGLTAEEAAAIQAVSWAGATATAAQIVLVPAASTNATDGFDLALAAAVDGALAHTISVGYSACEGSLSAAHQAFYAALYRQAAAEGIAVVAATGDSGAAACHSPEDADPVTTGWGVNALASTPWNTAVGAVAFAADGAGLTGWQPSSEADPAYATGGGVSAIYASPAWQSAMGVPATDPTTTAATAAHHRYLPDLSLPVALYPGGGNGIRGPVFCFADAAGSSIEACRLVSAGGSNVSAAVFSGVAALLAQKYGPQGNLAPNLYALDRAGHGTPGAQLGKSEAAFVDITSGGAKLRCVAGSPACTGEGNGTGEIGFASTPGFDLATGLGSVNAGALIRNWASPDATGTAAVTVEMTTAGGVTYNPSAIITLSARVLSGSGGSVPTGTVQFFDETVGGNTGTPVTLDSSGNATYSENGQFTVGGHNIAAIYSGDNTYESAESQPITINIQASPTSLVVAPSTTTPTGGSTITVTGTVTSTNPGNSPPTGTLTVNLDGLPQGNTTLKTSGPTTSGSVNVVVPSAGSHTVQGIYSGDVNYNNSTSTAVTVTVAKGATVTTISATPSTLTAGVPETFTATVAPAATTTTAFTITGTVSFFDGGVTLLGTVPVSSNTAILTGILLSTTSAHTITAVYSGDVNWSMSVSSPLLLQPILLPVTMTLTASNSVLAPGQSVTLTATVAPVNLPISTAEQHPTGNVFFYAGTTLIGMAALSPGLGDTGVATVFVPNLPAGAYVITSQYAGDTTYGPAVSNSLSLAVEDFTISCNLNNLNVVQGQTATVTCSVASLGGLAGQIQIVCAEQNPPQVGPINCTFDPTIINSTGQSTLTIVTSAGDISQASLNSGPHARSLHRPDDRHGPPKWPVAGGGVALAFAGLLFSPLGRRARWLLPRGGKLLGLALLMAGLAGTGLGCNNAVTLANNGGTPLGVHTLKITAAADVNTVTVSHYTFLTVNVTP